MVGDCVCEQCDEDRRVGDERQKRRIVEQGNQGSQTACFGMAGVELNEMYLAKHVVNVVYVSGQEGMVELLWRCCCCSCECLRLRGRPSKLRWRALLDPHRLMTRSSMFRPLHTLYPSACHNRHLPPITHRGLISKPISGFSSSFPCLRHMHSSDCEVCCLHLLRQSSIGRRIYSILSPDIP